MRRTTFLNEAIFMAKDTEIIYGIHAVKHALRTSPEDVLEIWLQEGRQDSGEITSIVNTANAAMISLQQVSRDSLDSFAGDVHHQGIALKRHSNRNPLRDLDSLLDSIREAEPFLLVLDGVQDPHNLGACLRTANAAGVDAIIIPRDRAVPVNTTVRKIACGAAEYTPVISVTNLSRALLRLQKQGVWCFGLSEDAEDGIYSMDLTGPIALVMGGEGRGLRQNTRKHCDKLVRIPMQGDVESLNISVAAAVCLYEVVRQRSQKERSKK